MRGKINRGEWLITSEGLMERERCFKRPYQDFEKTRDLMKTERNSEKEKFFRNMGGCTTPPMCETISRCFSTNKNGSIRSSKVDLCYCECINLNVMYSFISTTPPMRVSTLVFIYIRDGVHNPISVAVISYRINI